MRYWDRPEGRILQLNAANRCARNSRDIAPGMALCIVPLVLLAACGDRPGPGPTETAVAETLAPEPYDPACGQDGLLAVELYGGIRAAIDWRADELSCTGMPRPDGEGARIRFSGPMGSGDEIRTLAFILGLPNIEVGRTGTELPTNVTLIEEGTGRFFSTQDINGCWTDIAAHEPVDGGAGSLYRVEGTLYCVSPLAELNGNANVTFTELKFTGRLNWEQPE